MATHQTNNSPRIGPLTHYRVDHAVFFLPGGQNTRHAIYVESGDSMLQPSGWLFQVKGDPSVMPMTFDDHDNIKPLCSPKRRSVQPVGWVLAHGYLERIRDVCVSVPRPGPFPPNQMPRGSEDWTNHAINALAQADVLEPLRPEDPTGIIDNDHWLKRGLGRRPSGQRWKGKGKGATEREEWAAGIWALSSTTVVMAWVFGEA